MNVGNERTPGIKKRRWVFEGQFIHLCKFILLEFKETDIAAVVHAVVIFFLLFIEYYLRGGFGWIFIEDEFIIFFVR